MSGQRTKVFVHGPDPVSQAGVAAQLRAHPRITLVDDLDLDRADVSVISVDSVDETAVRAVRAVQRNGCPRVVLVVAEIDESELYQMVQEGVAGVVRRRDASSGRLVEAIEAAISGSGALPPDLLGQLMSRMKHLQEEVLAPRGLTYTGLTSREADVLRLVGDGLDTAEIAVTLSYSERTIKNVIQDVVRRFGLRNRYHALAYALRQGLI